MVPACGSTLMTRMAFCFPLYQVPIAFPEGPGALATVVFQPACFNAWT